MDAYEATRVVFSRIQALDPENASKIMGLLLIQDHGDKEMIRLAFGPESLLHSLVLNARKDLGLLPPSSYSSPASPSPPSPFLRPHSRLLAGSGVPPPLTVSSPSSWAPPPAFSRTNSGRNNGAAAADDLHNPADELISPTNPNPSPFYGGGGGDLIDELQLQDQLSFLNDPTGSGVPKSGDLFYPDECRSPSGSGDGMLSPYGMGWGVNGHHRRSCSINDLCLGSDPSGAGVGWRPCLYFARGYCKNGSSCRFLHGLSDDAAASWAAGSKLDAAVEQQCHELLLRSKSQRLGGASHLMASAAASAFPYSPTGSLPHSPSSSSSSLCMNFLLQQQQNDSQRAAAAAAALMLGGDETHKFIGRSRMERCDFSGMANPGSRQIYLTFPADSTFREEDVTNYFSIYGPVQDVRIPYQQKRMFGFVTFVYPETVKLILAKGNPHFVCDSRVLVKPYKEKGKVPDKYRKQQHPERGDFSGCNTPTGLDPRDPYDLQQLGPRMMYGSCSSPDVLLRRKLEEQQQQAAELQQAIELQGRRFMGLQLLDLKSRNLSSSSAPSVAAQMGHPVAGCLTPSDGRSSGGSSSQDDSPPGEKSSGPATTAAAAGHHEFLLRAAVNAADKEESAGEASPDADSDFQESGADHNLPDSPFASPTRASFAADSFSMAALGEADTIAASAPTLIINNSVGNHLITSSLRPAASTLDLPPFKSCFLQMPRFSGHGAIGM